jgi:ABC-type Fe3+-citrate transport system substrate-binding protein
MATVKLAPVSIVAMLLAVVVVSGCGSQSNAVEKASRVSVTRRVSSAPLSQRCSEAEYSRVLA